MGKSGRTATGFAFGTVMFWMMKARLGKKESRRRSSAEKDRKTKPCPFVAFRPPESRKRSKVSFTASGFLSEGVRGNPFFFRKESRRQSPAEKYRFDPTCPFVAFRPPESRKRSKRSFTASGFLSEGVRGNPFFFRKERVPPAKSPVTIPRYFFARSSALTWAWGHSSLGMRTTGLAQRTAFLMIRRTSGT